MVKLGRTCTNSALRELRIRTLLASTFKVGEVACRLLALHLNPPAACTPRRVRGIATGCSHARAAFSYCSGADAAGLDAATLTLQRRSPMLAEALLQLRSLHSRSLRPRARCCGGGLSSQTVPD